MQTRIARRPGPPPRGRSETARSTHAVILAGTPIAAHIHQAPPGTAGPILIPLAPTATSGTVGPLTAAQITALFEGGLYINYHTPLNPSGEIRGQITLVPGSCSCASAASF